MTDAAKPSAGEMEAYVRERWESIATGAQALHLSNYCASIVIWGYEFANWQATYDFTLAREQEIRLVEEEIGWVQSGMALSSTKYGPYDKAMQRILVREQAALTELKRGMK